MTRWITFLCNTRMTESHFHHHKILFDHSLFHIKNSLYIPTWTHNERCLRKCTSNGNWFFFSSFLDQKFPFLFFTRFVEMQMKTFCAYCVSKMTRLHILREWEALNDIFWRILCMNCLRKLLDRGILHCNLD